MAVTFAKSDIYTRTEKQKNAQKVCSTPTVSGHEASKRRSFTQADKKAGTQYLGSQAAPSYEKTSISENSKPNYFTSTHQFLTTKHRRQIFQTPTLPLLTDTGATPATIPSSDRTPTK